MNRIILIGRLSKEPELRYTNSGAGVCNFTLAVDRPFTQNGERQADFIDVVVWNKLAENCAKYLDKGRKCAVEGRLQIRSYEGNDGKKRYVTEVVAERVEFISKGSATGSTHGGQGDGCSTGDEQPEFGVEVAFDDGDVPF